MKTTRVQSRREWQLVLSIICVCIAFVVCLFVCLFVLGLSSQSRLFHSYGDVTITGEVYALQRFDLSW